MNAVAPTQMQLHPLCTLFPRLEGAEFRALCDDVRANGLRQPIVVHDDMILDGGNRYRACLEAAVMPRFVEFDGSNLVAFVLSANLHRRHMTTGQQATIVASATDWAKAQTVGRPEKGEGLHHLSTVANRAAVSGATTRTQKDADKLVREAPALAEQVTQGKKSLYAAVKESKPTPKILTRGEIPSSSASEASTEDKVRAVKSVVADEDGPGLAELVDELQAENSQLTALVQAAEANNLAAEAVKWRAAYDRALASQSEAMDAAARSEKREKFSKRQLMRCGKAVGEDDPRKIAAAVEALARKAQL